VLKEEIYPNLRDLPPNLVYKLLMKRAGLLEYPFSAIGVKVNGPGIEGSPLEVSLKEGSPGKFNGSYIPTELDVHLIDVLLGGTSIFGKNTIRVRFGKLPEWRILLSGAGLRGD